MRWCGRHSVVICIHCWIWCPLIHLVTDPPIHLSTHLHLTIHPWCYRSIPYAFTLFPNLYSSINPPIRPSIHPSVHLSSPWYNWSSFCLYASSSKHICIEQKADVPSNIAGSINSIGDEAEKEDGQAFIHLIIHTPSSLPPTMYPSLPLSHQLVYPYSNHPSTHPSNHPFPLHLVLCY